TLFLVTSLSLVAFGCSETPEPQTAANHSATDHGGTNAGAGTQTKDEDVSGIALSERLRKLCNIDAAFFAFDSANLDGKSQSALDQLAECFTKGAAKGKRMALVGHADERGEDTYNMGLG